MVQQQKYQLAMVCVALAIGFGLLWGFAVGGVGAIVYSTLFAEAQDSEDIFVEPDERVVIRTRVGGSYSILKYRTLDGKPIERLSPGTLTGTRVFKPYREPGLLNDPVNWRQRIAGTTDYQSPPVYWTLIRRP